MAGSHETPFKMKGSGFYGLGNQSPAKKADVWVGGKNIGTGPDAVLEGMQQENLNKKNTGKLFESHSGESTDETATRESTLTNEMQPVTYTGEDIGLRLKEARTNPITPTVTDNKTNKVLSSEHSTMLNQSKNENKIEGSQTDFINRRKNSNQKKY